MVESSLGGAKAYFHVYSNDRLIGVAAVDLEAMSIVEGETGRLVVFDMQRVRALEESEARKIAARTRPALYASPLYRYGDAFYNYDFDSASLSSAVDWPVNLAYYINADVNKAKSIYWGPTILAYRRWLPLNDGSGWVWDSDRGTKGFVYAGKVCGIDLGTAFLHTRFYADQDDKMWNTAWGYYVVATAHLDDWPEIPGYTPAGFNERAETLASLIASNKGYTVDYDKDYFNNPTPYCYKVGHKYYLNYGYADFIRVP